MGNFEFKRLAINDVVLVTPKTFQDNRGFFFETYNRTEFFKNGFTHDFVQDNQSFSYYGVLRGLHFQRAPKGQGKLVRCINGCILDVAVDIRPASPTYGKWVSAYLSASNKYALFIPNGFLHGFYTISKEAEIVYKCTSEYDPALDAGVIWNDPEIGISWPEPYPILSDKDKALPLLREVKW